MAENEPGFGLIERAWGMVLHPHRTWRAIDAETTTVGAIFCRYVLVLCAISPICFTLGRLVFGERVLGAPYRPPILAAVFEGMASYGLALAAVYVLALLIRFLAAPFGGGADKVSAFKVAAYSGTAGWLASVFYLYPPIGGFEVIGVIFNLYLLYIGSKNLILISGGRSIGFTATVVVCYVVLMMLVISLAKLAAALVP